MDATAFPFSQPDEFFDAVETQSSFRSLFSTPVVPRGRGRGGVAVDEHGVEVEEIEILIKLYARREQRGGAPRGVFLQQLQVSV